MNIVNFTPIESFIGGVAIGFSAVLMMYFNGKITGISGIFRGIFLSEDNKEKNWKILFIVSLCLGIFITKPLGIHLADARNLEIDFKLILAAIFVGAGTTLGSGCTSGHGICGISRGSKRSIIATCTFMITGVLTVLIMRIL